MPRLFFLLFMIFVFGISEAQDPPYQVINAENLSQLQAVADFPCEGNSPPAAFRGDKFVVTCYERRQFLTRIYSLNDTQVLQEFSAASGHSLHFLADDLFIWIGNSYFTVYDTQGTNRIYQKFYLHGPAALSPDGSHIAFVTDTPRVDQESYPILLYRLPDFELVTQSFYVEPYVQETRIALSNADSSLIAIGEYGGRIRILNWETEELVTEIVDSPFTTTVSGEYASDDFPTSYAWLAFSADASELYSNQCTHMEMGCWDMGMSRFDVLTGEVLTRAAYYNSGLFADPVFLMQGRLFIQIGNRLSFYDMDSLSELDYVFPIPACVQESKCVVNDEGTLIAAYDVEKSRFLIYGIPND